MTSQSAASAILRVVPSSTMNVVQTSSTSVISPSVMNVTCSNSNFVSFVAGTTHSYDLSSLLKNGLAIGGGRTLYMEEDGELYITQFHGDKIGLPDLPIRHFGTIKLKPGHNFLKPGTILKTPDGTILEINEDGGLDKEVIENARSKVISVEDGNSTLYESLAFCHFGDIHIPDGTRSKATLTLPNGTKLKLNPDDSVEIDDANGKTLYHSAPTRGFNKFLNASDLLEEFVRYCAEQKITKKDFSELPISLFIFWLIVKAAEADGDDTEEVLPLLTSAVDKQTKTYHRCKSCGKFLSNTMRSHQIVFCSPEHMGKYMSKLTQSG